MSNFGFAHPLNVGMSMAERKRKMDSTKVISKYEEEVDEERWEKMVVK
jgi:hypothetical protein